MHSDDSLLPDRGDIQYSTGARFFICLWSAQHKCTTSGTERLTPNTYSSLPFLSLSLQTMASAKFSVKPPQYPTIGSIAIGAAFNFAVTCSRRRSDEKTSGSWFDPPYGACYLHRKIDQTQATDSSRFA